MAMAYRLIGREIVEVEQAGDARPGYGSNIAVANVFDTLSASRRIRGKQPGGHSLAAVCRREFDKVLDKSQQISDWTRRPLTGAQVNYAALDVEILVDLFAKFSEIQLALLVT
jgi:ribonuclease D